MEGLVGSEGSHERRVGGETQSGREGWVTRGEEWGGPDWTGGW